MAFDLSSISHQLNQMSFLELSQLQEKISRAKEDKEKEVEQELVETYGARFTNLIGLENLKKIPIVSAEQVHLDHCDDYPQGRVHPDDLAGKNAARGVDGSGRPFLLLVVCLFDREKNKLAKVVEVVFRRYNDSLPPYRDNYVTALQNNYGTIEEKKCCSSALYSSGGMVDNQLKGVRDLLEGKVIEPIGTSPYVEFSNGQRESVGSLRLASYRV